MFAARLLTLASAALALGCTCVCSAMASCKPVDPTQYIATDRASLTTSGPVLPCHTLQIENGFAETWQQGDLTVDLPEMLVHFAVTDSTEMRFSAPGYYFETPAGSAIATGLGDLAVGMKQGLGSVGKVGLTAIGMVSLPTGANAISSHGYDPTLQVVGSVPVKQWTIYGMLSGSWPTVNGAHRSTGLVTAMFDRTLGSRCDGFVEYGGQFAEGSSPQHVVDFGIAFRPTHNQQVDMHGGVGASAAAPAGFVGGGYSFRFNFRRQD